MLRSRFFFTVCSISISEEQQVIAGARPSLLTWVRSMFERMRVGCKCLGMGFPMCWTLYFPRTLSWIKGGHREGFVARGGRSASGGFADFSIYGVWVSHLPLLRTVMCLSACESPNGGYIVRHHCGSAEFRLLCRTGTLGFEFRECAHLRACIISIVGESCCRSRSGIERRAALLNLEGNAIAKCGPCWD